MKRRITISLISLSLLLGLALLNAGRGVKAKGTLTPPPVATVNPLLVTNTNDSGAGSLRQAIADAMPGDTINFDLSGCPCTIMLTSGELVINKDLTITGPGANLLTISGNNASRVFFINPGAAGATAPPSPPFPVVILSNLKIANGKAQGGTGSCGGGNGGGAAGMGAGLFINGGIVTIDQVNFSVNQVTGGSGGSGNCTGGTGGGGGGVGGNTTIGNGGPGGRLGGNGGAEVIFGNGGDGGEGAGGGGSFGGNGGNGGFGGGGGGGSCCQGAGSGNGGAGGFGGGGGGGGSSNAGSNGGSSGEFGGNGASGLGGYAGDGGGGGGAGLGGAIFARLGTLTLTNSIFDSNSAAGGNGGTGKNNNSNGAKGQGKGGAIFIHTEATATACTLPTFIGNTATDAAGSGTDTNDVYGNLTITCNQSPIAVSKNVTVSAGANCTATVTADQVNNGSSDPDGDMISIELDSYGPFGLGAHPVTLTVTDSNGASSSANATVNIVDDTKPSITCPTPIVLDGSIVLGGARVSFSVTATDNCSGTPSVNYSKAPGSLFPFGVTTVTATADDGRGNNSQCSYTVTVRTPQQQTTSLSAQVQALVTSGALTRVQGAGLTDKLNEVIAKLNIGQRAAACLQLNAFISQVNGLVKPSGLSQAQGQALITAANNIKANIGC